MQIGSFHLKNLNAEAGILFPDEKTQTSERLNYLPKVTQLVMIEPGLISKLLTSNSGLCWAASKFTSQAACKDGNVNDPKLQTQRAGRALSSALSNPAGDGLLLAQLTSSAVQGPPRQLLGHSSRSGTGLAENGVTHTISATDTAGRR